MGRSVLLQLARDSIAEVFEAKRTIDRSTLLQEYPLLNQNIKAKLNLYLDDKLRGSSSSELPNDTLLDAIIRDAKRSAFEDKNFKPLTVSEYLDCEVEIVLETPDGVISEKDKPILSPA